jgi:hypothetical protein
MPGRIHRVPEHGASHLAGALVEGLLSIQERGLIDVGVQMRQIIASEASQNRNCVAGHGGCTQLGVICPGLGETRSGAALWALLGAGRVDTLEKAGGFVEFGRSHRPNQESVEIYDKMYPLYMKLYQHLGEAFDEVAELQRGLVKQRP